MLGDVPAMKLALSSCFAAGLLAGCVRHYEPPTQGEPHAIVKLRRTYEATPGQTLRENVMIEEYLALDATDPARVAEAPRTDALLVHPAPSTFVVKSSFFHHETRTQQETYYVQESYSDRESYNCGTGGAYRTCSRHVTRYRSAPKTRWVTRTVEVVDGACERALRFAPEAGRTYVLQYTYQDRGACALSCFEQRTTGEGSFRQRRCPAPPAED